MTHLLTQASPGALRDFFLADRNAFCGRWLGVLLAPDFRRKTQELDRGWFAFAET